MWKPRGIHTELVKKDHGYTSEDVPWQLDTRDGPPLFRYLRGGGVMAFGGTSKEEARSRRQTRFLVIFAALAAIWLIMSIL